jgi:CRISPR-associated protein Csd1
MGWMQKLYETYEQCADAPQFEKAPLLPVNHTPQQAHIEIVLDQNGTFQRAARVNRESTVVPASEDSAGRTTNIMPHPLCDKIQYCASDYERFGGTKKSGFSEYVEQLRAWQKKYPAVKVQAVLHYVERGTLVADLLEAKILSCDADNKLLTEWTAEGPGPDLLKMLTPHPKTKKRDQGDAFIRWRVQVPGDPNSAVWQDPAVVDSWINYSASVGDIRGLCMVTGEVVTLAVKHPKRVRHPGDGARLLSSNDTTGFTFLGRFECAAHAFGVGSIVTQKAHSALRWLIERQGRKGDQVFVAWAVSGSNVPDPLQNTAELFEVAENENAVQDDQYGGDAGQHFALRLKKAIAGYRARLSDSDNVVVIGLDSATSGRLAITYYRELTGSEFLDRITTWHERCSWSQNYSKNNHFTGAPAPVDIAEAAYGKPLGRKQELRKATVERLLPCIVDGRPLPRDLVESAVRRAANRVGLGKWEWEKCLGVACSIVRGSSKENYEMSLEEDRTTRDYLYGRLLAIAENIEDRALYVAKETRDTTAAKLMQRFASHPFSTWRNIEIALVPYRTRLRANRPAVLLVREKLLDAVQCMFRSEDFTNDTKLSGEFLLGYHCQRAALWNRGKNDGQEIPVDEAATEGEME